MWNEPSRKELAKLPRFYETEPLPVLDKTVHMHFFLGGSDWYVVEFDGDDLFFGYVILNNDKVNAEWGYFSFRELKKTLVKGWIQVDRDLNWEPKKAYDVRKINKSVDDFYILNKPSKAKT